MFSFKEGWLARDEDGTLWVFAEKPYKDTRERRMRWESDGLYEQVEEDEETEETRKISWEDPEPTHVKFKFEII